MRVSEYIRGNVIGCAAFFLALVGTAYAIDKNSVKSKHIKAGAVKESDIGPGAVTAAKLAPNSVGGANVLADSLGGADIDESSLELAAAQAFPSSLPPSGPAGGSLAGTYPNPTLAPLAVGMAELAGDSVTAAKIAADAVGQSEIATNGVAAGEIADNAVDFGEIATDAVRGAEIQNGAVLTGDISDGTLTRDDLDDDAVYAPELADTITRSESVVVPGGTEGNGDVESRAVSEVCDPGEQLISGGADWLTDSDAADQELYTVESHIQGVNSWVARGANDTDTDHTFRVQVLCLFAS